MRWLTTLTFCVCTMSTATNARAAQYEFAFLSFPDGGIRWIDKTGARSDSAKSAFATDIFVELSGQNPQFARSSQYKVLVLNGLSKSGWELVQVIDAAGDQAYLLKREARVELKTTLSLGQDFEKNGSIKEITLVAPAPKPAVGTP